MDALGEASPEKGEFKLAEDHCDGEPNDQEECDPHGELGVRGCLWSLIHSFRAGTGHRSKKGSQRKINDHQHYAHKVSHVSLPFDIDSDVSTTER